MRKILFYTLLLMFTMSQAQELRVMSWNIRLALESDKENSWENRRAEAVQLLNYYRADLFGVQEALPEQMQDIKAGLKNYSFVGVGRDDGKNKGEFSAIFFNTDKLEVQTSGTFWLSETPEKPSKGWDAAYNRVCTYALFKVKKNGRKFWAFNTHFDHVGVEARDRAASLILAKIGELNKNSLPVVLTGDFNLTAEAEPLQRILAKFEDAYRTSESQPYGPRGTFTAFDIHTVPAQRIDHIFVKGFVTEKFRTIGDRRENLLYPSDHFPLLVTLRYK